MNRNNRHEVPVMGPKADALFNKMRRGVDSTYSSKTVQYPLIGPDVPERHSLSKFPSNAQYLNPYHNWRRDD